MKDKPSWLPLADDDCACGLDIACRFGGTFGRATVESAVSGQEGTPLLHYNDREHVSTLQASAQMVRTHPYQLMDPLNGGHGRRDRCDTASDQANFAVEFVRSKVQMNGLD